jgi:uncharacterized DUF497 family protein
MSSARSMCGCSGSILGGRLIDKYNTFVYTYIKKVLTVNPSPGSRDERKNELNLAKHGIDFDDAIEVFYGPVILHRSDRNNEERWVAIGYSEERLVAVIFTRRADVIRIISARRARKNEERDYRNAKMGRPPEGQD